MNHKYIFGCCSAIGCALSLTACATPTRVKLPSPPAELVAPLPPQPQVPAEANDASVAGYITALREYGRTVAARFDALAAWVRKPG
jgi:hypothetical protein